MSKKLPPGNPQKRRSWPIEPDPPQQQPSTRETFVHREQIHIGPLPPPELLKGYEEVSPGLGGRIVQMAETEGQHRRSMEIKVVDAQIAENQRAMECEHAQVTRGQTLGFVMVVVAIGAGAYTAAHGQPIAGGVMSTFGIGSIVTAFIWGRKQRERADSEEDPDASPKPE